MTSRWARWAVAALAAVGLVAAGTTPATAKEKPHEYLALGDSVPFGFNPLVVPPDARKFVGYPELAAPRLGLALTNASCPGEASGGFLAVGGADNGCSAARAAGVLHTNYTGTQLAFALAFLRAHPRTELVSLTLGANDLFLCQKSTSDGCPTDIRTTLAVYGQNLTTILTALRGVYHHDLVAVTYYSTDYRDPQITGAIAAVNAVTSQVVAQFDGTVADGFTAFQRAAARHGGDPCAAGLLIRLSKDRCDIHPSRKGAQLLARTLAAAADVDMYAA